MFSWRISSTTLDNITYHTLYHKPFSVSPAVGGFAGSTILQANRNPSTSLSSTVISTCCHIQAGPPEALCFPSSPRPLLRVVNTRLLGKAHEDLYMEQVRDTPAPTTSSSAVRELLKSTDMMFSILLFLNLGSYCQLEP